VLVDALAHRHGFVHVQRTWQADERKVACLAHGPLVGSEKGVVLVSRHVRGQRPVDGGAVAAGGAERSDGVVGVVHGMAGRVSVATPRVHVRRANRSRVDDLLVGSQKGHPNDAGVAIVDARGGDEELLRIGGEERRDPRGAASVHRDDLDATLVAGRVQLAVLVPDQGHPVGRRVASLGGDRRELPGPDVTSRGAAVTRVCAAIAVAASGGLGTRSTLRPALGRVVQVIAEIRTAAVAAGRSARAGGVGRGEGGQGEGGKSGQAEARHCLPVDRRQTQLREFLEAWSGAGPAEFAK